MMPEPYDLELSYPKGPTADMDVMVNGDVRVIFYMDGNEVRTHIFKGLDSAMEAMNRWMYDE